MIASVLSKKVAAGATHIVIDIPVGPTAKVRTRTQAKALSDQLHAVAAAFELTIKVMMTDGRQPIGRGIGPALEARDVLAVLSRAPTAPPELARKACQLAGALLESTWRGTWRTTCSACWRCRRRRRTRPWSVAVVEVVVVEVVVSCDAR